MELLQNDNSTTLCTLRSAYKIRILCVQNGLLFNHIHVADGYTVKRSINDDLVPSSSWFVNIEYIECRFQLGFIPAGEGQSGGGGLKLGRRHVALLSIVHVATSVETFHVIIENASELNRQFGLSNEERRVQQEDESLIVLNETSSTPIYQKNRGIFQILRNANLFVILN